MTNFIKQWIVSETLYLEFNFSFRIFISVFWLKVLKQQKRNACIFFWIKWDSFTKHHWEPGPGNLTKNYMNVGLYLPVAELPMSYVLYRQNSNIRQYILTAKWEANTVCFSRDKKITEASGRKKVAFLRTAKLSLGRNTRTVIDAISWAFIISYTFHVTTYCTLTTSPGSINIIPILQIFKKLR